MTRMLNIFWGLWKKDFTDKEREEWTHKIGNLVLISRRKNSLRVMQKDQWRPLEIEENQKKVLLDICTHYCNINRCKNID